jgi:hypothetical protein
MSLVAKHMFHKNNNNPLSLEDLKEQVLLSVQKRTDVWNIKAKLRGICRNYFRYLYNGEISDKIRRVVVLRWVGIL